MELLWTLVLTAQDGRGVLVLVAGLVLMAGLVVVTCLILGTRMILGFWSHLEVTVLDPGTLALTVVEPQEVWEQPGGSPHPGVAVRGVLQQFAHDQTARHPDAQAYGRASQGRGVLVVQETSSFGICKKIHVSNYIVQNKYDKSFRARLNGDQSSVEREG